MKPSSQIHPTAVIAPGVKMGSNVKIEPFVVINSPHVILDEGVVIKSRVYLDGYTTIGAGTIVHQGASIGTQAQDHKYGGERTFVHIGRHCVIHEFVTINSPCQENSIVKVGDGCCMLPFSHIAHNCVLGNRVMLGSYVSLGGHVTIEDDVVIGKLSGIHQHVRIGRYARVAKLSKVTQDMPPFVSASGIPAKFAGLNVVGLNRHLFSLDRCEALHKACQWLYFGQMPIETALSLIETEWVGIPEIQHFVQFCRETKRGLLSADC